MKTLHLNLKRKWFDMILSGEKKEEYRANTQYWYRRLRNIHPPYKTITFSNGYRKDRDQFVIELKEIVQTTGNPLWGAIPGKKYYVLKLGEIINQPK